MTLLADVSLKTDILLMVGGLCLWLHGYLGGRLAERKAQEKKKP